MINGLKLRANRLKLIFCPSCIEESVDGKFSVCICWYTKERIYCFYNSQQYIVLRGLDLSPNKICFPFLYYYYYDDCSFLVILDVIWAYAIAPQELVNRITFDLILELVQEID